MFYVKKTNIISGDVEYKRAALLGWTHDKDHAHRYATQESAAEELEREQNKILIFPREEYRFDIVEENAE